MEVNGTNVQEIPRSELERTGFWMGKPGSENVPGQRKLEQLEKGSPALLKTSAFWKEKKFSSFW